MDFKEKASKSIALSLVGITVVTPILYSAYAMENIDNSNLEFYSKKISSISEQLEEYVVLKNNQYLLDISDDKLNKINKNYVDEYTDYLNNINNIIRENNIQNVSLENGFILQVSDAKARDIAKKNGIKVDEKEISTYAGISRFRWTKNGFDWWLTDFQAGLILTGASAGVGALISLIPGIGWTIALNIANAVITFAASNSVRNGIKISYRAGKYLRIYSQ